MTLGSRTFINDIGGHDVSVFVRGSGRPGSRYTIEVRIEVKGAPVFPLHRDMDNSYESVDEARNAGFAWARERLNRPAACAACIALIGASSEIEPHISLGAGPVQPTADLKTVLAKMYRCQECKSTLVRHFPEDDPSDVWTFSGEDVPEEIR